MNLCQYALMTHRTTGTGLAVNDYFERRARTGDDRPATPREAERVREFCKRVIAATPEILPGEAGEGNDLWCEADQLAADMRGHITRMMNEADAPAKP